MKHPPMQLLQDYFENVLNSRQESVVRNHVHECDWCTKVLADFAVIETKMRLRPTPTISVATRARIFQGASELLAQKRTLPEAGVLENYWREWKEISFPELRVPALQLCSLSVVLFVLVAVEKEQSRQEEIFMPLSDEVQVLTYKDTEEST